MNKRHKMMLSTLAMIGAGILSACSQSDAAATEPATTPMDAVVTRLTAPKEGLTANLEALRNLTFWWEAAPGDRFDNYEVLFDHPEGDFSDPVAAFATEDNRTRQLTISYDEVRALYEATQQEGAASLIWSVGTVSGDEHRPGTVYRSLTITDNPEPYVVEALFEPQDGSSTDLTLFEGTLAFSWSPARSNGLETPTYTLLLDRKGGDFSQPLASFDAGEQTAIALTAEQLRSLFDSHAESGAEALPLSWRVRSNVGDNSWLSTPCHTLTVTERPIAYTNPIFSGFSLPDPDVIRADDGYFYLYATEHSRKDANMKNVPIMRSSDLINWTRVGSLFTDTTHPQITDQDAGIWAPSVNRVGNQYVIYYSQPGQNYKHAIGVAVSDSPTGPFRDLGKLIDSNEQGVDISIDAYLYQENGHNYLFWGSFRSISVLELTEDGLAIKNKETQKRREVAGGQYEATVVVKRDGWYYLIVSTGNYAKGGTYRLVVGRSKSLFGPYVDKEGRDMMSVHDELVLQGNDLFSSPGHCSRIITDDAGQDWILYHAYPNDKDFRCLMLDRINWVNGWPEAPGLQPSSQSVERPVFN